MWDRKQFLYPVLLIRLVQSIVCLRPTLNYRPRSLPHGLLYHQVMYRRRLEPRHVDTTMLLVRTIPPPNHTVFGFNWVLRMVCIISTCQNGAVDDCLCHRIIIIRTSILFPPKIRFLERNKIGSITKSYKDSSVTSLCLIQFPCCLDPQNRSCSCSFPVVTTGTWHVRYSLAALGYDFIEYCYDILPPNDGDVKGVGRTSKKNERPNFLRLLQSTEW